MKVMDAIATTKLYREVSLLEYNEAQQKFIAAIPAYKNSTVEKRWDLILDKFKSKVPPELQAKLETFQKTRKNTNANIFKLSLKSCLSYFEHFYFLYQTDDSRFKLDKQTKKNLLETIDDAMKTCETGISTRFEMALQLYRTDMNWVNNVLHKQRCNLLIALQNDYNKENHVDESMEVHVLKIMTQLAADSGLGIRIDHSLKDIFAGFIDREDITQYFHRRYPATFFVNYEEKVVETLSQHLLKEIETKFFPENFDWNKTEAIIEEKRTQEFSSYLDKRLALGDVELVYRLGDLYEAIDPMNPEKKIFGICLKNRNDFLVQLRSLVSQKLCNEQYQIPIQNITKENKQLIKDVKLRNRESMVALVELNDAILNYNKQEPLKFRALLQKHVKLLLYYPDLLLNQIESHPNLLGLMPNLLKTNSYFRDNTIARINRALLLAIKTQDSARISLLISHLFDWIKDDSSSLNCLTESVLNYPQLAYKIVAKDGLLLEKLFVHLQADIKLVKIAVKQNPFALAYAPLNFQKDPELLRLAFESKRFDFNPDKVPNLSRYYKAIKKTYTRLYDRLAPQFANDLLEYNIVMQGENGCASMIQNLQKMEVLHQLLFTENLNVSTVIRLANSISPSLLIKIINSRADAQLSSLPYCKDASFVEKFVTELRNDRLNDWDKGYLAIKRQACELTRNYMGSDYHYARGVAGHMAKTDSWFVAMLNYKHSQWSFNSWAQFWLLLKDATKATAGFLLKLAKLASIIVAGLILAFAASYLTFFLPIGVVLGILGVIALAFILDRFCRNRHVTMVASILSFIGVCIIAPDYLLATISFGYCLFVGRNLPKLFLEMIHTQGAFFKRVFGSLFTSSKYIQELPPGADLNTKCLATIERLKLIDSPSAQEKGELLERIWNQINIGLTDQDLAKRLNQRVAVFFQGKTYSISFQQAAALPRSSSKPFAIPNEPVSSKYGFFKTTTTKLLPATLEPIHSLAMLSG